MAEEIVHRSVETNGGGLEARDALVGDLEISGSLHEAVVATVEEVLAEGCESLADLGELLGRLLFAAVCFGEALLEGFVLLLELDDHLLQLRDTGGLGAAHPGGGREPEGGGDCLVKECVTEGHRDASVLGLLLADTAVLAENAGRGKLTEFVPDHVLGDEDRHMLAAVVDRDGVANEVWIDDGCARPGLHDALLIDRIHCLNAGKEPLLDERSLLRRT